MKPGAVWQVNHRDDIQFTPQVAMQRAYAQAQLYEQQHQQRELVAHGLLSSGVAAYMREIERIWGYAG